LYTVGDMLSHRHRTGAGYLAHSVQMGAIARAETGWRVKSMTPLAQGLAGISLQLEAAEELIESGSSPERIQPLVHQALSRHRPNLEEARRSVLDLRAAPLEGRTLADAIVSW